jgi:hypothetical protein
MISLADCMGLCDLSPEEVQAISEHEHVPEIIAATLGSYLLHSEHGPEKVRQIIVDDIRSAVRRHDIPHARQLVSVLRHFLHEHPELRRRSIASRNMQTGWATPPLGSVRVQEAGQR